MFLTQVQRDLSLVQGMKRDSYQWGRGDKDTRYKKAADLSGLDSDSAGVGVKSHIYFGTCAAQDLLGITGALATLSRHTHLIQATH